MTHVAMLGRTFHREVINLGFSGNGRMDPEVVKFVAELDPAVFVLDCLPNMGAQLGLVLLDGYHAADIGRDVAEGRGRIAPDLGPGLRQRVH